MKNKKKLSLKVEDLEERIAPTLVLANYAAIEATDGVDLPHKALGHTAIHQTEGTPANDVLRGLAKDA